MDRTIRVLVVDDHEAVRRSIRSVLSSLYGIEICGEAVDGADAIAKARDLRPDVVTMDVTMPGISGIEATAEIRRFLPRAQILVVTQHSSPELIAQALRAGADGYVLKANVSTDLAEGLERLQRGEPFVADGPTARSLSNPELEEILQRNVAFQRALRQSSERLQQLLDEHLATTNNMAEGLFTVDSDGLLTSMNPAAEAMLGWTREELLGRKMHAATHHTHPDGAPFPASDCPGLHVLRTGVALREHADTFIRKDGSFMPVVFSASPLVRNGEIAGVVVGFRDDTEQRQNREQVQNAKKELEMVNSQFQLVTSKMGVAVVRCSRDLRYLWANERYAEWIQRPVQEIIGSTIVEILGPAAFHSLQPRFEQVLNGTALSYEQEVMFRGVGPRWISASYHPTFDSNGACDGWVAVVIDITDRKRMENALRESERKLMAEAEALIDLNRLSANLNRISNAQDGFDLILYGALQLTRAGQGTLQIFDAASGTLKIVAQRGFQQPFLSFFDVVREENCACGAAMQSGERVIVEDVTESPIFAGQPSFPVMIDAGVLAVQSTRLVSSSGKLLGILSSHFGHPHKPSERDLRYLDAWARHAADYLERMEIEKALRESEQRYRTLAEGLEKQLCVRAAELETRNAEAFEQAEEIRDLSLQLLRAQDEERRRVARGLHDTAGQTLAVMQMLESRIHDKAAPITPHLIPEIDELRAVTDHLCEEIRTTSYLLHPPLLDEVGLSGALDWLVQGFSARSGLRARAKVSEHLGRLTPEAELAIFKVVQESLTNVHRYSDARRCSVQVVRSESCVSVIIEDDGRGMTPERLSEVRSGHAGVGIRGMRERIRQLRGTFRVDSDTSGTRVSATLPFMQAGESNSSNSLDDASPSEAPAKSQRFV